MPRPTIDELSRAFLYPFCPYCRSLLSVDNRGRCTECGAPQQLAELANLEADRIATAALAIGAYTYAA